MFASRFSNSIDCVKLLLEHGTDPTLENNEGEIPCDKFFEKHSELLEKYDSKRSNT